MKPTKKSALREPKSYPSPAASSFGTKTNTPAAMALANALRGLKYVTEVPLIRDGIYRCERGHISEGDECASCGQPASPMSYSVDILVEDRIAVEVEGEGSGSKDNEERDRYLRSKGFVVVHVPNEYAEKHGEVVAWALRMLLSGEWR